jgi:hypothetical protein
MPNNNIRQGDDASLAELMDFARNDGPLWSSQDLRGIWRHQLHTSLTAVPDVAANEVLAATLDRHARSDPPIRTFGELLLHPRPPVELLEFVKHFAKACRLDQDSPVPDEIPTILYILSIVAAMTKCDRRISKMDPTALRHCLAWALEQTWLDEPTRQLLTQGHEAVGTDD